ncbi:MAG: glycosyltransferase family 4 protein [Alphaproteobacteria bacterium]|nr:glycosyltransferase family 4 protein [Alphaproteobacteria bacterium]
MTLPTNPRCLLITTHYLPLVGGAQTVYDELARNLHGHLVILTSHCDYTSGKEVRGWNEFDRNASYNIIRLPKMRPRLLSGIPSFIDRFINACSGFEITRQIKKRIRNEMQQHQYDAICIGALDALGYLVSWAQSEFSVPVLIYAHGEEIGQTPYNLRADKRRASAIDAADGIVTVSSYTQDLLQSKYSLNADRIEVVTNGVDFQRFSARKHAEVRHKLGVGNGPLVVSVGRLVSRKGFDQLIEAWNKVRGAVPGAELVIAGSGPYGPELEQLIAGEGLGDHVHMLGRVDNEMLPSLYASADLFAMPNRTMPDGDTEGFGLVFLEAAAVGTPAVGGRAGGVPDAILDGKTGVLVDGNDTDEIADAIIGLLRDDERREKMAKAAQAHAKTQGWDGKARQFMAFVERLIQEKKAS